MVLSKHGVGRRVLLVVTVLMSSCVSSQTAAAQLQPAAGRSSRRALAQAPPAAAQDKPQYEHVFAAVLAMPEGKVVKDFYMDTYGMLINPDLRAKFQGLLTLGTDRSAQATFFWPVVSAWSLLEKQLCMTVKQIQDTLASAPDVAVQYVSINIVNGTTILSSEFKDGLVLQTLEPGFSLTMRKRVVDGATQWYFPGVAYNGDDVTIQKVDVTAGRAVIHFTDYYIYSPSQRIFWQNQAKLMCTGPTGTPSHEQQPVNAGMIAGIAIAGAVAGAAVIALVIAFARRKKSSPQQEPQQHIKPSSLSQGMPPPDGAGSGRETTDTAGRMNAAHAPDESDLTRTPDVTQEPLPSPVKERPYKPAATAAAIAGSTSGPYSSLPGPATPQSSSIVARSVSGTASLEGSNVSATSASQSLSQSQLGGESYLHSEELGMTPVFEPNPKVPESRLAAWLRRKSGKSRKAAAALLQGESSGVMEGSGGSETSSSSGMKEAAFADQLRLDLHPQLGNPHIVNNYTNFTREVEHSNTAVYFADGMHNNRQFALKFYASHADFEAEMLAYRELAGPSSKFVPVLEMSYPGSAAYPTSVLVFERGQCTLETFARQRPSYFQQIDIFHQLVSAVQHLHEHGVVHRDLKPSNVVHFPEKFAWKLIDLATIARIGEEAKMVYTREYVSPEVAQAVVSGAGSIVADASWDLWGIGIIMWELATGQRYFPPEWSMDGGRRMWSALCGFEPLPHELVDVSQLRGVDRGVMKLVRKLLQRDPALRPTPRQLLSERLFQARGVTTTQVSQGSNFSHGSTGSGNVSGPQPVGD